MQKKYKKILIVDDDPNQIKLLSMYLSQLKMNIISAKNGRHAISILKDNIIDLVFTDYQMPEMDGITMINKIRKELKLNIPIIVISANENQSHFVKLKNVKVIGKPFTQEQIREILK